MRQQAKYQRNVIHTYITIPNSSLPYHLTKLLQVIFFIFINVSFTSLFKQQYAVLTYCNRQYISEPLGFWTLSILNNYKTCFRNWTCFCLQVRGVTQVSSF
jgi:hypothetical protein